MTLSILIPTYQYDCSQLVRGLHALAERERMKCEIIVCHDGLAYEPLADHLRVLEELKMVRVIFNRENQGRAGVRNFLAAQAIGRLLLFVDSDAAVPEDFSLLRYVQAAEKVPVVCGGLRHPEVNPCPEATLRFKYERKADLQRSADIRNRAPYDCFSTFSLLIDRALFLTIRFDSSCTDYGYEDTLFGAELERRGIPVLHIDNPLVHMGLEPNEVFLRKTETALLTLRRLTDRLRGHSALIATADRLRKWHLSELAKFIYKLMRPFLLRNLQSGHPSLFLFSFYKLGYYLTLKQENSYSE